MALINKDFRIKNGLVVGAGSGSEIVFPSTRGNSGDVLVQDANGNLVFEVAGGRNLSVTVASHPAGGNAFYVNGVYIWDVAAYLQFAPGVSIKFDQSDPSNAGHPLAFSTTIDGTHGGGTKYLNGVAQYGTPGNPGAYTEVKLPLNGPTLPADGILYAYCEVHPNMAHTAIPAVSNSNFAIVGNALFLGGISAENYITEIVGDTTPQLGGNLDVNGNAITSSGAVAIELGSAGFLYVQDSATYTNRLSVSESGIVTINDAYSFPTADGTSGQVLQTDGNGNLSFATVSAGGTDNYVANGSFSTSTKTITLDRTGSLSDINIDLSGAFVSQGAAGDTYVANAEFNSANSTLVLTKNDNSTVLATISSTIASLDDIPDVNLTGLSNNDIIKWDNNAGEWVTANNSIAGATASAILPFAFGFVNSTSNGSGTGVSWSNWNSNNSSLDFTFTTAQPDTNYAVITDSDTFDDYFVGVTNKTTTGFRAEFYDNSQSRTPSSFSPFTFLIYGSNPIEYVTSDTYTSIGDLPDVNLTGVSDGEMLVYDAVNAEFIAVGQPSIPTSINGFNDVNLANVSDGDILVYDAVNAEFIAVSQSTEQDTLDSVTGRGNSTTNAITVGSVTTTNDLSVGGNAIITGDLRVNGTTTTVNSTEVNIADKNIILGANTVSIPNDAVGAGITIDTINASIIWDGLNWSFNESISVGGSNSYKYDGEARISFDSNTTYLVNKDVNITGHVFPQFDANNVTGHLLTLSDSTTGQLGFSSSLPVAVKHTTVVEGPVDSPGQLKDDRFGQSVILHGNYMIVGMCGEDRATDAVNTNTQFVGAVAVYDLSRGFGGTSSEPIYSIYAETTSQDRFGNSIAVYGNKLVVGEYIADTSGYSSNAGKVFVYELSSGTKLAELLPEQSGAVFNSRFGFNVTASEGGIVVTEPGANRLYSFDWDFNLRTGFPIAYTTINSDIQGDDAIRIAANGYTVVLGDRNRNFGGVAFAGTVFKFDMRDSTPSATQFYISQTNDRTYFGDGVDINEKYIAVTARSTATGVYDTLTIFDAIESNELYKFQYGPNVPNKESWQDITPQSVSNAPDSDVYLHGDYALLTISSNGTPSDFRIDVFDLLSGRYLTTINNPDDYASIGDDFAKSDFGGRSFSMEGNRVAVGAPLEDVGAATSSQNAGKVYLFDLENVHSSSHISAPQLSQFTKLSEDRLPGLSGDLEVNGFDIKPGSNTTVDVSLPSGTSFNIKDSSNNDNVVATISNTGNLNLTGQLIASGNQYPTYAGANGQFLTTDGAGNLSWGSPASALSEIINDTTPQLGGELDVNGNNITNALGNVTIDGIAYPSTDGSNGQVLTTDGNGNIGFTSILAESAIRATFLEIPSYAVTVSNNKFYIDGVETPALNLTQGLTYKFDLSDSTCTGTDLKFSGNAPEGPNAPYIPPGGDVGTAGTEYTLNVTTSGTPGTDGVVEIYVTEQTDRSLWYYNDNATGYGSNIVVGQGGLNDVVKGDISGFSWRTVDEPIQFYSSSDNVSLKNPQSSTTRPTTPISVYSANTAIFALNTPGHASGRGRQTSIYQEDDTGRLGIRAWYSDNQAFFIGGLDSQTFNYNDVLKYQSGMDWNNGAGSGPYSADEYLRFGWSNNSRSLIFKGTGDGELRHSHLRLLNDYELRLGDNNEFKLSFNSSSNTSIIEESAVNGILNLKSDNIQLTDGSNEFIVATSDGVTLKSNNTTALTTNNADVEIAGDLTINGTGGLTVDSGVIGSSAASAALLQNSTTVTAFNSASSLQLAATTGTTTIRNDLNVGGGVTISGDLNVTGTTTTNSTSTIATEDALLILNAPRTGHVDLGLVAGYTNSSSTQVSTGFFHDATDSNWKLFDGYTPAVSNNATINTGHASFSLATLEVDELIGSVAWSNITNKPDPTITLNMTGDVTGSATTTLTDLGNGTLALTASIPDTADLTFANLEITGDLIVSGTTTTTNQETLSITDSKIFLAANNNADSIDAGVIFNYYDTVAKTAGIFRDATDGKFKFFDEFTETVDNTINTGHASYSANTTIVTGTVEANLIGNVTGDVVGNVTGDVTGSLVLGSGDTIETDNDQINLIARDTLNTVEARLIIDATVAPGEIRTGQYDNIRIDRGSLLINDNTGKTVTVTAPTAIDTNYTLTLPTNNGNAQDVLVTDGSGTLSFADPTVRKFGGDKTFTVTVSNKTASNRYFGSGDSGTFFLDGIEAPELEFEIGATYTFDLSDATCAGYSLVFYYEAAQTNLYNTNIITSGTAGSAGAFISIEIDEDTPSTLHYNATTKSLTGAPIKINTRNFTGLTSDDITEGAVNLYYTDAKVDAYLSAGTGVSYASGLISIGQAVGTASNVQFGNITLQQNGVLNLSGSGTVTTPNLNVTGEDAYLNFGQASPSANASIYVDRGTGTDAYIRWDEGNDKWVLGDGNTEYSIITSQNLSTENLDADTLDGNDSTYFLNYNNLNNTPTSITAFGISDGTAGQVLTTDGAGNFSFTTVTGGGGGAGGDGYVGVEDYFYTTSSPTTSFGTAASTHSKFQVFVNGVLQDDNSYAANTATGFVTLNEATLAGDEVMIYAFNETDLENHDLLTVSSSGNLDVPGTVTIKDDRTETLITVTDTFIAPRNISLYSRQVNPAIGSKLIITVKDNVTGDTQITEALVLDSASESTGQITTYGTLYTGSARLCSFDVSRSSSAMFLVADMASTTNSTTVKIAQTFIT